MGRELEGDGKPLSWTKSAKCMILSVEESNIISLGEYSLVHAEAENLITVGICSKVTGLEHNIVSAGNGSMISLEYWDGKRTRLVTAYVGEDGIEETVKYKLDSNGKFIRA